MIQRRQKTYSKEYSATLGKIKCDTLQASKCDVRLDNTWFWPDSFDIIDTDYETYSIVQSRTNNYLNLFPSQSTYIYSREPLTRGTEQFEELEKKTKRIIQEKIPKCKYSSLQSVYQGLDCTYIHEKSDFEFIQELADKS